MMRAPAIASLTVLITSAVFAQAPLAFEVASIKPSKTGGVRGPVQVNAESLTGTNVTLTQLMRYTYELQDWQLSGPGWIETEGYDITAETSNPISPVQLRLMLQTLLE